MKKFLLIVILSSLFIPMMKNSRTAKACGGGGSRTIEEFISEADVVVRATPISSDYLGQNGILLVDQYFKGSGGQFILFSHLDPSIVQNLIKGYDDYGSCTSLHSSLDLHKPAYFFLRYLSDGSYFNLLHEGVAEDYPWIRFSDENTTVEIYDEDFTHPQVNEEQLVERIIEISGQSPQSPNIDIPYPMYAPLRIITSTSKVYLLPIDGQPPVEVTPDLTTGLRYERPDYEFTLNTCETCLELSPDSQLAVGQPTPHTVFIPSILGEIPGEAYLIAPTSDAVAVWNKSTIEIYQVVPRSPDELFEPRINLIDTMRLEGTINQHDAAWSPDGRFLAYSDDAGLWMWDVYTEDSAPRLLIAAEDNIPYARYFSPLGRYLAFTNGNIRGNLDIISGEMLPDGLVSPDERTLLAFDTSQETSTLGICGLTTDECSDHQTHYNEGIFKEVQWRNSHQFFALTCLEECEMLLFEGYRDWYAQATSTRLNALQYTYDDTNNALAVLINETTIAINPLYPFRSASPKSSPERIDYDLSSYIEGEIVDIEWLPSLFYNPPR